MINKVFPTIFLFGVAALFACGDENTGVPQNPDGNNNGLGCTACSGETVCVENACADAFPRFYMITVESVTFPTMKANGDCWDEPGCGAPDPQVTIKLNDNKIAELDTDDDMFSATFPDAIEAQIIAGSKLEIALEDEDIIDSEEVLTCTYNPLTADKIRNGDLSCSGAGASITAHIAVRGSQP